MNWKDRAAIITGGLIGAGFGVAMLVEGHYFGIVVIIVSLAFGFFADP